MGENFTDGPKGEAERSVDKDGTEYHRPQDNRNVTGSKVEATHKRLHQRKAEHDCSAYA